MMNTINVDINNEPHWHIKVNISISNDIEFSNIVWNSNPKTGFEIVANIRKNVNKHKEPNMNVSGVLDHLACDSIAALNSDIILSCWSSSSNSTSSDWIIWGSFLCFVV